MDDSIISLPAESVRGVGIASTAPSPNYLQMPRPIDLTIGTWIRVQGMEFVITDFTLDAKFGEGYAVTIQAIDQFTREERSFVSRTGDRLMPAPPDRLPLSVRMNVKEHEAFTDAQLTEPVGWN